MAPSLGIIADDFTGGLMVAGYIEELGIHCPVAYDPVAIAELEDAPVVVAAGRTRTIPLPDALAATAEMADALDAIHCERIAYKACATFDSTETGNIGPIADFLADRLGARPVIMSAGFPAFEITVHQGYLFVAGRLVTESHKRFDPLTPMPDPDLVRFLGHQTPHPVRLINHRALQQGAAHVHALLDDFSRAGVGHVLMDVTDDGDVVTSAEVAAARQCTVAAGDSLIIGLADRLVQASRRKPPPAPRHVNGPAAVFVGSVGPIAESQLKCFAETHPIHVLDLLDPRGEEVAVADALAWARALTDGKPFAVATTTSSEGVKRAQAALGAIGAARRAERMLAAVATGLRASGIRRFIVSGGETSGAIVAGLNISRVRSFPKGKNGTGFCVAEDGEPLSLYLKPGKMGSADVLLRALEIMRP
jgi:uncharacterized protein YgbK (DUF1537 family)